MRALELSKFSLIVLIIIPAANFVYSLFVSLVDLPIVFLLPILLLCTPKHVPKYIMKKSLFF
jgi:hypothetical protein